MLLCCLPYVDPNVLLLQQLQYSSEQRFSEIHVEQSQRLTLANTVPRSCQPLTKTLNFSGPVQIAETAVWTVSMSSELWAAS